MKTNVIPVLALLFNFKEMDARYRFPVFTVESCPSTLQSRNAAADRMNCSKDKNNNPMYFCVPNQAKTALLEFCYDDFLGLIQDGYCLHLSTSGYLNQEDCHFFIEGCPTSYFLSNNIYQFPKCQQIDMKNRCFLADPKCISSSYTMSGTIPVESSTSNTTTVQNSVRSSSSSSTFPPTSESEDGISSGIVAVILCSVATIILLFFVLLIYKRWWRKRGRKVFEPGVEEMGLLSNEEDHKRTGKTYLPHHCDPHSDVEVQEEGNNLHIRVTTHHPPDDDIVRWEKDGLDIDFVRNSEKYLSICHGRHVDDRHVYLYVYDTTNEDSGLYSAIWRVKGEEHKIDIQWQKDESNVGHRKHGRHKKVFEVLVRQYGNDLRIRVTTNNQPSDVKWRKNGEEINVSKNAMKYLSKTEEDKNYIYLYIFDLKPEDSGSYSASWEENNSGHIVASPEAKIHLEAIKLIGPAVKVEKDRTQTEKVHKMENIKFPIFPVKRTYNLVIIEKEEFTENLSNETFGEFDDDDVRRLLYFGILLSERRKINWNNKADMSLLHDIKKLMQHKQSVSVDEYKSIASEFSGVSLHVDEEGVSFLNEDVEIQTMWALMQNHNTKQTIAWMIERRKIDIIQKYFRTADYEREKNEICVVLCDMLCDDFKEFLIEHYIRESDTAPLLEQGKYELLEMKKEGYKFSQKQSTLLQCAVYYSLMAGKTTTERLTKYFRSSGYAPMENEMCICLPAEYNDELIRRLNINILIHQTISDTFIHRDISKILHIPAEVIKWTQEQRERYVKNFKTGSIKMYRARGMIVGCAGSGKTTLLRRLQRRDRNDMNKETQTTIGLEVHDNIFLVENNTLKDYLPNNDNQLQEETDKHQVNMHEDQKLLSMTDFAGQVAYYACHQIYLSRRAFYILVVDMSKDLSEIPYLKKRHNPMRSLFQNWTYEAYFVFWLQSIKTYCDDERMQEKYGDKAGANPVILIASHHDCLKTKKKKDSGLDSQNLEFYKKLEKCLPKKQTLKEHISDDRYFEIECPKGKLNKNQTEIIEKVRACIAETAVSLPQWGEEIPVKWSIFEHYIWANKAKRILERKELKEIDEFQSLNDNDINDMLRFYQESGQIIYFSDRGLRETIILDVQWFVDAFKNIITDPAHARSFCKKVEECEIFMDTGRISDSTLCRVWRKYKSESYVTHKDRILPYMEKLGILAKVWTQELRAKKSSHVSPDEQTESVYYIPSINKTDITEECKAVINNGNKTPILVFYFSTYLPHFFFFRLVVRCFSKWESLSVDFFCKNAAFYTVEGGDHNIAIAVNKSSIQLQVFSPDTEIQLSKDKTREIRKHVEDMIMELTQTFHERVGYETGYACKDINVTDEDEDYFLNEETVAKLKNNERRCPIYNKNHEEHVILRDELLQYWYKHKSSDVQLYQREASELQEGPMI